MKKFILLGIFAFFVSTGFAQTTILSPTGDGGFETGTTFAANGWTTVNGANGGFYIGTGTLTQGAYSFQSDSTKCAFFSNTAGASWQYMTSPAAVAGTSHMYRDITFPAGQPNIHLSFVYIVNGEASNDEMLMYMCPTTLTPLANSPTGTATTPTWSGTGTATLIARDYENTPGQYIVQMPIDPSYAGTTVRFVISWKNNATLGAEPPLAIDEITFTSSPCNANANIPMFENFESNSYYLPTCWFRNDVNADGVTWAMRGPASIGLKPPKVNNVITRAAACAYNSLQANNDWMFTKAINFVGGQTYKLSFKYASFPDLLYTEKLEVKYGSTQTPAGMSTLIYSNVAINDSNYATATATFTPATSGAYYLGFHDFSAADQFGVFVDDISICQNVNFTSQPANKIVCANTAANFVVATSAVIPIYQWQMSADSLTWVSIANNTPTGVSYSGITNDTLTVTGTQALNKYYYRCLVMDNYGCPAYSSGATLKINGLPSAPSAITGTSNVCINSNAVHYSISPLTNNLSYTWSLPTGASIAGQTDTNNISVNYATNAVSGIISVHGNNACGQGPTQNYNLTISSIAPDSITSSITGTDTLCQGSNGVAYSITAVNNANTYVWTLPSGVSISGGAATNNILVNYSYSAVSGYITVHAQNACGVSNDTSLAIHVNQAASNAGAISGPNQVCTGTTGVVYSITPIVNVFHYVWTLPAGATIVSNNDSNVVTVNYSAGAASGNITVLGTNATGCNGIPASLAVSTYGTVTTNTIYSQGFNSATYPAGWAEVDASNYLVTATSGTYPVCSPSEGTYMVKFNSFSATSGITATLKQTTSISSVGYNSVSVLFDWYEDAGYTTNNDNVMLQWSTNGTTWTNATSYARYNAVTGWKTKTCVLPAGAANQSTLYVAFLFTSAYGNDCHLDNLIIKGTSGTGFTPTITGTATKCAGTTAALSVTGGGVSYQWQQSSDNITFANVIGGTGAQTANYTTATLSTNTYYRCVTGCTTTTSVLVTVVPAIPATAGIITGLASVCQGVTGVTYSITAIPNTATYVWTLPTGATITAGTGTNAITVSYATTATSGNVSVYGQNVCGNGTASTKAVTIKVTPAAAGAITGLTALCQNTTGVAYSVAAITNAASYTWAVPSGSSVTTGAGTASITASIGTTAGSVSVYGVGATGCVGTSATLAISISTAIPTIPVSSAATNVLCSSFTANWTTSTGATSYHLDVATNATFTSMVAGYNNLVVGNVLTKNVSGLSSSTTYYYRVRAYNACGNSINSAVKTVVTSSGTCYCVPTYTSACSSLDYIDNFSFSTLTNNATGCNALTNNYIYYSTPTTTVNAGTSYAISMQSGTTYGQGFRVWIDYNQDGDFADANEAVFTSTAAVTTAQTGTVLIPATAATGQTRLRVRCLYNAVPIATDYCSNLAYGETEDYLITIASGGAANMVFQSTTSSQASTAIVNVGAIKAAVLRCQVVTTGTLNPLTATTFNFNTNGTTNFANIKNAKLYYTSASATFATTNQVGSIVLNPNGSFSINANQQLVSGSNYFWLAYDINCNSTNNNVVDAQFTSVNVGTLRTPIITNPAGNRSISAITIALSNTTAACGNNNGTATATVSGGNGSYIYNWSNGSTTNQADSLSAGQYSLQVFDALNCTNSAVVNINASNGPALSSSVINVTCNGGSNGSITTNATGGTAPYSYLWNTGATTSGITNVSAGAYDVTLTDGNNCQVVQTINVNQASPINISFNINDVACGSNQGNIKATVTGGTGSGYTYLWSANTGSQTTDSVFNLTAGLYTLTVHDGIGCSSTGNAAIVNSQGAGFTVSFNNILPDGCLATASGAANSVVTGGSGTLTYAWSNGISTPNISGVNSGIYYLTVTDGGNGCVVTESVNIPSVLGSYQPQICLVTVDTTTMTNQVVWEKPLQAGIQSFKIYREGSVPNAYLPIATVPFSNLSVYTDSIANPAVRGWRYKISAIDSCNIETPLSDNHKTIHLSQNPGFGGAVNLSWDFYEGFTYTTFYIWRDDPSTGWVVLDSLPNNLTTYTDLTPPSSASRYMIEVKAPYSCSPTARTAAATVNTTRSNTRDNYRVTGKNIIIVTDATLYPNPASDLINVSLTSNTFINNLLVFDAMGRLVKTISSANKNNSLQINTGDLATGIYFIQINTNSGIVRKSFVKQ